MADLGFSYPPISATTLFPYIFNATQLGQIVTNTTTETAFAFQASSLIPANTLKAGDTIVIEQDGVYESGLSQSVQPFVRFGPSATALTSRSILLTTAGAVSGLLNSAVDLAWSARTAHQVQANGVSIVSTGRLSFSTGATAALSILVANTMPVGFDPTIANVLTTSAAWTNASAANQIRAVTWTAFVLRQTS